MLGDLKYLECCIDEALRKYPIVPVHFRKATRDYKLADSDLIVSKGSSIIIPVLGFQRDPQIYENPMQFRPERFINSSNGNGNSEGLFYTPFGKSYFLIVAINDLTI
jgi:cytochrome P450 family 6